MITVFATREGLLGRKTSSGWVVDGVVPFVALPSTLALRMFVRVVNPLNGIGMTAIVLDTGPWNIDDHPYVFQTDTLPDPMSESIDTVVSFTYATFTTSKSRDDRIQKALLEMRAGVRPQSEEGIDRTGRKTNRAGIDLGERLWRGLQMKDNGPVCWRFL